MYELKLYIAIYNYEIYKLIIKNERNIYKQSLMNKEATNFSIEKNLFKRI